MTEAHDKFIAWQTRRNDAPIEIDWASTVLLVIDMQEYFANPGSPLSRFWHESDPGLLDYFHERQKSTVIPNLKRLVDAFRSRFGRVIFTTVASEYPDGGDLIPLFRKWNEDVRQKFGEVLIPPRADQWAQIVEPLAPNENEVVINKTTFNCFASTGLDGMLRNMGIETLIIGGVHTSRCVETTVRDATDRGYRVILVDDGTATWSQELQEMTMLSLMVSYGFVRATDEVMALLDR